MTIARDTLSPLPLFALKGWDFINPIIWARGEGAASPSMAVPQCNAFLRYALAATLAVGLATPSWAQDPGSTRPAGIIDQGQYQKLNRDLEAVRKELQSREAEVAGLKAQLSQAQAARKQADDKAAAAQQAALQASKAGNPEGVPPEQLEAVRRELVQARKERETAASEADDLKRQLAQAQAQLKRAQADLVAERKAPSADETALRSERDRLKRDNKGLQDQVDTLQAQLAAAKTPAKPAVMASANTASSPLSASTPTTNSLPPATALRDLTELSVPGCGAACPSFIVIPAVGAVTLGSGDKSLKADIRHRYALGKTEVTVGQWKAFWNATDREYQPVKTDTTYCSWNDLDYAKEDRLPVACVNVADAEAYVRWFTKRHGDKLGVRIESIGLPSDAEWELAARGGRTTFEFSWADGGDQAQICRHAQTGNCPGGTVPVDSGRLNGYGLYGVVGNAWEWTRDARTAVPPGGSEAPAGASGERVVGVGAVFLRDGGIISVSRRVGFTAGFRVNYLGFRLVARIAS